MENLEKSQSSEQYTDQERIKHFNRWLVAIMRNFERRLLLGQMKKVGDNEKQAIYEGLRKIEELMEKALEELKGCLKSKEKAREIDIIVKNILKRITAKLQEKERVVEDITFFADGSNNEQPISYRNFIKEIRSEKMQRMFEEREWEIFVKDRTGRDDIDIIENILQQITEN